MFHDPIGRGRVGWFQRLMHPASEGLPESKAEPSGPAGTDESSGSKPSTTSTRGRPPMRMRVYLGIGVAIVVVMVVVGYLLVAMPHSSSPSGSNGYVLVPYGTGYSMSSGQYNAVNFVVNTTSSIHGLINSSRGIQLYIMTPAEYGHLVTTLNVSGYVWTSGIVADQTIYSADIPVAPGQWVLAFVNPFPNTPTGVGFYSNLVLQST